jgi:hypothetical protein
MGQEFVFGNLSAQSCATVADLGSGFIHGVCQLFYRMAGAAILVREFIPNLHGFPVYVTVVRVGVAGLMRSVLTPLPSH